VRRVKWVKVAKTNDIPPGHRKIVVPFRGRAGIGIFNIRGGFYALRNICPHKGAPLCTGRIGGRMVAAGPPSTLEQTLVYESHGEVIRCPWHLWEFDIRTGRCLVDSRAQVLTFPLRVEEGTILVQHPDSLPQP